MIDRLLLLLLLLVVPIPKYPFFVDPSDQLILKIIFIVIN